MSDYTPKQIKRLWSKVNKNGSIPAHCPELGACWEWTASKNAEGYGRAVFSNVPQSIHRVTWVLANGKIPDGLWVLHKCDNPSCCNPAHLFLGTAKDNMQDKQRKGRGNQAKGEQSGRHKVTEEDVVNIRNEYVKGVFGLTKLSQKYGITIMTVRAIITRRTWKHVK